MMPPMRNVIVQALKIFALVAILPLGTLTPGHSTRTEAGGLVVTSTADSGFGSFRVALTTAANNPGPDTIFFDPATFPPGAPVTIHAEANYIVEAPAASDPLTIDANGAGVIFDFTGVTEGEAAFHFRPDGPVTGITLRNFTIQNFAPDDHHAGHGVEIGFAPTTVSNIYVLDMTIRNNQQSALRFAADELMSRVTIQDNSLTGNGQTGIQLFVGSMEDVIIQRNEISDNTSGGLELEAFDSTGPSTVFVSQNTVTLNGGDGIFVSGEEHANTARVTISRNITSENGGLGINLLGFGNEFAGVTENDLGDADMGPNDLLNFPVFDGIGPSGIVGNACANCLVELFNSDFDESGHGEGEDFVADTIADGNGDFTFSGCGLRANDAITATATDDSGNTSEFALNYTLLETPPCALTQGDLDCDGDVDSRDALMVFIYQAGAEQLTQQPDCPSVGGSTQPVSVGPLGSFDLFGDIDCSDSVDVTDGLILLQHLSEVTLNPAPPGNCTPIGEPLPSP